MKNLLFFLLTFNLYALIEIPAQSKQLLVVSSKGFTDTQALLHVYERHKGKWEERFTPIAVNLGRSGLAWGEGIQEIKHLQDEPIKHEGDGKSPAGLFPLESFFGYGNEHFNFPYLQVNDKTLCIDESDSEKYNTIVQPQKNEVFKSFEFMRRDDDLYRLGIVVGHNQKRLKQRGSCIFIHIQKEVNASTSGCTSMRKDQLYQLMQWLDIKKRPLLLQLPQSYLKEGFK